MKIFVVLSLCITLSLGCSNLPKLEACNRPEGDCSCQEGLVCVLTKKLIHSGKTVPVKRCMPADEEIVVETVNMDNPSADFSRNKRLFGLGIFNRCLDETDCKPNYCCAFSKRCLPKLLKYFTCNLTNLHKCGCRDELVCKQTSVITIPIIGTKIPIMQCMEPEA